MNATTRLLVQIGLVVTCASPLVRAQSVKVDEQKASGAEQSVLASAKDLYAAASYEAALLELSAIDTKEDVDQVDTYRALCQLALDRPQDAEQTLEQIVTRKPLYTINDAQYSPRLVSMFRDVRKRALPGAVQQLYVAAKVEYEGKNYSFAAAKFQQLFSVLGDPDISDQAGKLADFRELADGFLKLSEQKLAEKAPAPVAAAPVALVPASAPTAAGAVAPTRYTLLDAGVRPPVVINQTMPNWRPPQESQYMRNHTFVGRLEILIDEQGAVETATLVKSIWSSYDPAVLQAATHWRYQPALKDGKPVKFRKFLDITVTAADAASHP